MQIRQQALSLLPVILSAVEELGKQKVERKRFFEKKLKCNHLTRTHVT
jgi:hypothetical protein